MTVYAVTVRILKKDRPWDVQDHFPSLFTSYEKALDYIKRVTSDRAEPFQGSIMDDCEEWCDPLSADKIHFLIEECGLDVE